MTDDSKASSASTELDEIIAEYIFAEEAGESVSRDQLLARHPAYVSQLKQFFADRDQFKRLASPLSPEAARRNDLPATVRYFGDYELLEEIAQGGMGVVYKARQTSLNRIVAVKMVLAGHLASEQDVKRFEEEAKTAATLKHRSIVPIHEVGRQHGQHYFSMDYIEGRNLAEVIRSDPPSAYETARIVKDIAEAVDYAHQEGIVHRDIKPSNILIDQSGEVRITDFGLALRVETESGITQTGQILGTPAYMPPEQARGKRDLVGPPSDIYAIGAILYELLTGRPPFRGETAADTIRQLIDTEPLSPRQLNPGTSRDLETICLKCLEKTPHQRYATAQLLADDLTRLLQGEPIQARPISHPVRFWRWCQRKPAMASMLTVTGLAVTALITGLIFSNSVVSQALRERTDAFRRLEIQQQLTEDALEEKGQTLADLQEQQRLTGEALQEKEQVLREKDAALLATKSAQKKAEQEADRAATAAESEKQAHQLSERYLYMAHMNLVQQAWEHGDVDRMVELLERHRPEQDGSDLRGFEWYFWWHKIHPRPGTFSPNRSGRAGQLCLSQDGRVLARILQEEIYVARSRENEWFESQLRPVVYPYRDAGRYLSIALTPDGKTLASGTWGGNLVLWDLITDQPSEVYREHSSKIQCLEFSPDGSLLATADDVGTVVLWDMSDHKVLKRWTDHNRDVHALAFSPDGSLLASAGYDRVIQLRDTNSGDVLAKFNGHTGMVYALAFSPDGRLLASGGSDQQIILQDVRQKKVLHYWPGHNGWIKSLAFSPDGKTLASGSNDRSVRLWETETRNLSLHLKHHRGVVQSVRFTPDGKRLYSNADDGTAFLDLQPDRSPTILPAGDGKHYVHFLPDNRRLIDVGRDIRLIDTADGSAERIGRRASSQHRIQSVQIQAKESLLLARSAVQETRSSQYQLFDLSSDRIDTRSWIGAPVDWAAITNDGLLVSIQRESGKAIVRECLQAEKKVLREFKIAATSSRAPNGGLSLPAALSPDSQLLASRSIGGQRRLWNLRTGELAQTLTPSASARAYRSPLFFSQDSEYLIECQSGRIRVWHVRDGSLVTDVKTSVQYPRSHSSLERHLMEFQIRSRIALSPARRRLAVAENDGVIQLIDLTGQRDPKRLVGHSGMVSCVKFSTDGRSLISGGTDRTIRIWDELTGELKTTLTGHKWPVTSLDISPDGHLLISSGGDELRFWHGGAGQQPTEEPTPVKPKKYTPAIASTDELIASLAEEGFAAHETAVSTLANRGKPATESLLAALEHRNASVRRGAARALGRIREKASAAMLGKLLNDENELVREAALFALQQLDEAAPSVLIEQLNDARPATRLLAIEGLASLVSQSEVCRPAVLKMLDDPDREVRLAAAAASLRLGSELPEAVKLVVEKVRGNSDRQEKLRIVRSFGGLRTDHAVERVLPLLLSLLKDQDAKLRGVSLKSLFEMQHPAAKNALLNYAREGTFPDRELVVSVLDWLDPVAGEFGEHGHSEAGLRGLLDTLSLDVGPQDWPQWGGSRLRNNAPEGVDIPTDWDAGEWDRRNETYRGPTKNVKWSAPLGSQTYGNVVVANGKVLVGTNNGRGYVERFPSTVDLGCLLCFDEQTGEFLWQYSSPKLATGRVHDWPLQGLCATPVVDGDRIWVTTNRCEVICLDLDGFHDGENDGPMHSEISQDFEDADVIWKVDMMGQLGVSPHNMTFCSPLIADGKLFVCTANGLDESHLNLPSPEAPSFLAMDVNTGEILWTDNSPGRNILHGQWGSPSYGVFDGQPQVIFSGGDGWLYSFDPKGDGKGGSRLLWKFDGNPKESRWILGGSGSRNNIIAFPVIYDGLVYITMGQDPEHGEGPGHLWCIDPTKRGDVSPELAVDAAGEQIAHRRIQAVDVEQGERTIPNPNSALVWHYSQYDSNDDGEIDFEEEFHRSVSTPVIKDDILYIADFSGLFHCLDAKTGRPHWTHDLLAQCWGSALVVDDKVFIGDEDGVVTIFEHAKTPRIVNDVVMNASVYSTPIVANNVLYVTDRRTLFAIASDENIEGR